MARGKPGKELLAIWLKDTPELIQWVEMQERLGNRPSTEAKKILMMYINGELVSKGEANDLHSEILSLTAAINNLSMVLSASPREDSGNMPNISKSPLARRQRLI